MEDNAIIIARLASHAVSQPNGCLLWAGFLERSGYAKFWYRGRMRRAHRVAWELVNGAIPDGMDVCHRCHARACVNIDHLYLASHRQNCVDSWQAGRWKLPPRAGPEQLARGARHGNAKLTDAQACEIVRASHGGETTADISRRLGLPYQHVWAVATGRAWKHLQGWGGD